MKIEEFPPDIQPHLMPSHDGRLVYRCLGCSRQFGIEQLLYVCPECRQVLLLEDANFERLTAAPGTFWRRIFDYRKMLTMPALRNQASTYFHMTSRASVSEWKHSASVGHHSCPAARTDAR